MNIFYVDENPHTAATMLVDRHVVKMILEGCQILSSAHHELDGPDAIQGIYKKTHKNHPSVIWARSNKNHYEWLYEHTLALCKEYTFRYGKTHKSQEILTKKLFYKPRNIHWDYLNEKFYPPPKCMPDEFKVDSTVESYRNYYRIGKKLLHNWKNRNPPDWIEEINV